MIGIYFIPTFLFVRKWIVYLFSVILTQADQPTAAGDILGHYFNVSIIIFFLIIFLYVSSHCYFLIDNTITTDLGL